MASPRETQTLAEPLERQAQELATQINEFNKSQMRSGVQTPEKALNDFDNACFLKKYVNDIEKESPDISTALKTHLETQFKGMLDGSFKKANWEQGFAAVETEVNKIADQKKKDEMLATITQIQEKAAAEELSYQRRSIGNQKYNNEMVNIESRAKEAFGPMYRQKMWVKETNPSELAALDQSELTISGAKPKHGPGIYRRPGSDFKIEEAEDGSVIAHYVPPNRKSNTRLGLEAVAEMGENLVRMTTKAAISPLIFLEYAARMAKWVGDASINYYKKGEFNATMKRGFLDFDFIKDSSRNRIAKESDRMINSLKERFEFLAIHKGKEMAKFDFPNMKQDRFDQMENGKITCVENIKRAIYTAQTMLDERKASRTNTGAIVDLELGKDALRLLSLTDKLSQKEKDEILASLTKFKREFTDYKKTPAATETATATPTAVRPPAIDPNKASPETPSSTPPGTPVSDVNSRATTVKSSITDLQGGIESRQEADQELSEQQAREKEFARERYGIEESDYKNPDKEDQIAGPDGIAADEVDNDQDQEEDQANKPGKP